MSARNERNTRRCIIPAKRYYEWDRDKKKATFSGRNNQILYMVGLYNLYDGQDRFVIITIAANDSVKAVYERMPLILQENEVEKWILDDTFLRYALRSVSMQLRRFQEYEQQRLFL